MKGGIPKFNVTRHSNLLGLIPEDGTPIRFKDLKVKCKDHKISYRVLLEELQRMEDRGMIIKEAVIAKRGAGTQYKRYENAPSEYSEDPIAVLSFTINRSRLFNDLIKRQGKDKDEQEMAASRNLNFALDLLKFSIINELAEYVDAPDKEQAKKSLNSVLKDNIFPLIERMNEFVILPEACGEKARRVMKRLTEEAWTRYKRTWEIERFPPVWDKHTEEWVYPPDKEVLNQLLKKNNQQER